MTDLQALQQYTRDRDPHAFEVLVQGYQGLVVAACRRYLSRDQDVQDATQETFFKLARRADEVRTHLGGWLHRCAVNTAIDVGRRQQTRRRHEGAAARERAVPPSEAEDGLVWAEVRAALDRAVLELDDEQRWWLIEHYLRGRSQAELAAEREVAPATASRRVTQALAAVRTRLGPHLPTARGTTALGAALSGVLAAEAAASVPAGLTAGLLKIGVSGVGGSEAAASATAGVSKVWGGLKAVVACLVGALVVAAVVGWVLTSGGDEDAAAGDYWAGVAGYPWPAVAVPAEWGPLVVKAEAIEASPEWDPMLEAIEAQGPWALGWSRGWARELEWEPTVTGLQGVVKTPWAGGGPMPANHHIVLIDHLRSMRGMTRLLRVEARRALAAGDVSRAEAAWLGVLDIAERVRQHGVMTAQLIGVSIESRVLDDLEAAYAKGGQPGPALIRRLAALDSGAQVAASLVAEVTLLDAVAAGPPGIVPRGLQGVRDFHADNHRKLVRGAPLRTLLNPPPRSWGIGGAAATIVWEALAPMIRSHLQVEARARMLTLAVELRRYRDTHGRWPAGLADLPGMVPVDPFNGEPFGLSFQDVGFVLTGTGRDGSRIRWSWP